MVPDTRHVRPHAALQTRLACCGLLTKPVNLL
jgi:hypothetical protein